MLELVLVLFFVTESQIVQAGLELEAPEADFELGFTHFHLLSAAITDVYHCAQL